MHTVRYTAVTTIDMHRLIRYGKIIKATVYQSFFASRPLDRRCVSRSPIRLPTVCSLAGRPFRQARACEFAFARPGQLPLLSDAHPYAPVQPPVQVFNVVLHVRNSKIVQPSTC